MSPDSGGASEPGSPPPSPSPFDAVADRYEALHGRNVRASGEPPAYFADYKLACLERLVGPGFDAPILDYGCGIGTLTERLAARFPRVSGYDPSRASLALARQRAPAATFHDDPADLPRRHFGLVVLANVLHHVPPAERVALVTRLGGCLARDGLLVVFEHNPWNPLTRHAVATCPFDGDAVLLGPRELTRLLTRAGLCEARRRFIVFFPRALAALRRLEPGLGWLAIGAQVMAIARAP